MLHQRRILALSHTNCMTQGKLDLSSMAVMALIGPRPMMPHQRELYHGDAYYTMRPGVSGYWQVSDRHGSEFVARVHYDDLYERKISLVTDVFLILRTLRAVSRGTGA